MLINSESLIPIIITLAAAAVGLCYLPVVRDVSAFIIKQRQKTNPTKQLEQKVLKCHQGILDKIEARTQGDVEAVLEKMEKMLEKIIQDAGDQNRQEIRIATGKYLNETQMALNGLVEKAAERIDGELTQQLDNTRTELENYKKERARRIDEEIATLVEKTIYKTLGKGLSPTDHLDIIYESLAEAKEEGFFDAR